TRRNWQLRRGRLKHGLDSNGNDSNCLLGMTVAEPLLMQCVETCQCILQAPGPGLSDSKFVGLAHIAEVVGALENKRAFTHSGRRNLMLYLDIRPLLQHGKLRSEGRREATHVLFIAIE